MAAISGAYLVEIAGHKFDCTNVVKRKGVTIDGELTGEYIFTLTMKRSCEVWITGVSSYVLDQERRRIILPSPDWLAIDREEAKA